MICEIEFVSKPFLQVRMFKKVYLCLRVGGRYRYFNSKSYLQYRNYSSYRKHYLCIYLCYKSSQHSPFLLSL